jgi:tetratricopeptide (TPR) repeat protein
VTSREWGFDQGFDAFYDDLGGAAARSADRVVDDASGWLNGRSQPWFVWVHLYDAHVPYAPPGAGGDPYHGEVAFMDAELGRLLAAVDLERSLVIVLADHGEGLGSHGEATHGVLLYDATTRVPLVLRGPGGPTGVVTTPVSVVDVVPTVLAAVGAPAAEVDGRDLARTDRVDDRAVYVESLYTQRHFGWSALRALVTDDWKLVDGPRPELYARGDDAEVLNLASAQRASAAGLKERLDALVATPASRAVAATPEAVAALAELGYVTATVEGPALNPVEHMPVLAALERARDALARGDGSAARRAAEEAVAADPTLDAPRLALGALLAQQGDIPGALSVTRELDGRHPTAASREMVGVLLVQGGDPAGGARVLSDALTRDARRPLAWTHYLHALAQTRDPRLAAEVARGRSLLPDSGSIRGMEGLVLVMRGEDAAAEAALVEALRREPEQPLLRHALAGLFLEQRRHVEAEAQLLEEIRRYPPAVPSRRALIALWTAQGRHEEASAQREALASQDAAPR